MLSLFLERKFKMLFSVEKAGKVNFLAGTAHFFPYSFKKSLTGLIKRMDTVLFEGPLDERNMEAVRSFGTSFSEETWLYKSLDKNVIKEIDREFALWHYGDNTTASQYLNILSFRKSGIFIEQVKNFKPWMAFFVIWALYLKRRGWKFSVDREAHGIATKLGKQIVYLESIDEQIKALDAIPLERIIAFLNSFRDWERFVIRHKRFYLKGDLDRLFHTTLEFPTRCDSIIDKRDPIIFERLKPYMEKGRAIAFVGTIHLIGLSKLLEEEGFTVKKYA